jgi:hypothetical protein
VRLTLSAEPPPQPPLSEGPDPSAQAAEAAEARPAYFEEYDIRAAKQPRAQGDGDDGAAAAAAAPGEPNLLLVAVVRARGLLAMDTNLFGGQRPGHLGFSLGFLLLGSRTFFFFNSP